MEFYHEIDHKMIGRDLKVYGDNKQEQQTKDRTMKVKIGDRVGAILDADNERMRFLGYGTYHGEQVPPEGFLVMGIPITGKNPKIVLDNGKVVWGFQCWWGPEEKIKETIAANEKAGIKVTTVDLDEADKADEEKEQTKESGKHANSGPPLDKYREILMPELEEMANSQCGCGQCSDTFSAESPPEMACRHHKGPVLVSYWDGYLYIRCSDEQCNTPLGKIAVNPKLV